MKTASRMINTCMLRENVLRAMGLTVKALVIYLGIEVSNRMVCIPFKVWSHFKLIRQFLPDFIFVRDS